MDDFDYGSDDIFHFIAGYTGGGAPYGTTWEEVIERDLIFRAANRKDSNEAARLIHQAIGDIAEQQTGQTKPENIHNTLATFFREEANRFSYQNTIVADVYGEVVGLVIAYPGEGSPRLDEPLLKRLRKKRNNQEIAFDKECEEGDFYIDTLCVKERYQGHGIGTTLLQEAEHRARQAGYLRISLNVDLRNPSAKKLYERLGYKKVKVFELNRHPYEYMVKILE